MSSVPLRSVTVSRTIAPKKIAVAYLGTGWKIYLAQPQELEYIVVSTDIGTNPSAVATPVYGIGNETGIGWNKVFFLDELHAKIYVGDKSAMIGSANLTENGLSGAGLEEIAVVFTDSDTIADRGTAVAYLGSVADEIKEGDWLLLWKANKDGLPCRRGPCYWEYVHRVVGHAVKTADNYTAAVFRSPNPPPVPFKLDPEVTAAIFAVLSRPEFKKLRRDGGMGEDNWRAPNLPGNPQWNLPRGDRLRQLARSHGHLHAVPRRINGSIRSIGSGKMMVDDLSPAIAVRVSR